MTTPFRAMFNGAGGLNRERAKYLSRLLGIFSERIVCIWANDERAPFENLGRPTLRFSAQARGHTLDFAFRDRLSHLVYVAEMKCEIEYQGFKYFVLKSSDQLDHHRKPAFEAFLRVAREPDEVSVKVAGKQIEISGAILVWGAADPAGRSHVISERGFHDVVSVEDIQRDLVLWKNQEYLSFIGRYREWSNRLFDGLVLAS